MVLILNSSSIGFTVFSDPTRQGFFVAGQIMIKMLNTQNQKNQSRFSKERIQFELNQAISNLNHFDDCEDMDIERLFKMHEQQIGDAMEVLNEDDLTEKERCDKAMEAIFNSCLLLDVIRKRIPKDLFLNISNVIYFINEQNKEA